MDLIGLFTTFDRALFLAINSLPHSEGIDQIFLFFSFYPLIIWTVIGVTVTILEERREKIFIVRLILALLIAGWLASGFIKPIVRRPRPDLRIGNQVIVVKEKPAAVPWNNDFAFPSGHAAIAFAGAYIVTREETYGKHGKRHSRQRNRIARIIFIGFAVLTAFSRIFLGKHYPLDVVAGAVLGWLVGYVSWKIIDLISPPHAVSQS